MIDDEPQDASVDLESGLPGYRGVVKLSTVDANGERDVYSYRPEVSLDEGLEALERVTEDYHKQFAETLRRTPAAAHIDVETMHLAPEVFFGTDEDGRNDYINSAGFHPSRIQHLRDLFTTRNQLINKPVIPLRIFIE